MKKLLLALTIAFMSAGVFATPGNAEQSGDISAISPYVGLISGIDVKFDKMYVGIGRNFMPGRHAKYPKYYVGTILAAINGAILRRT